MKLLILTQKVDRNDPILGFFHRWIEEFATKFEKVTVICLEKGAYNFSANVEVLSLGKERGNSKLWYILRFYKYILSLRQEYDSVFVHMNPEYVILGGIIWRFWHKKIGLWYVHRAVTVTLRLAEKLADSIFTSSKESFNLKSKKVHYMGHGLDMAKLDASPLIIAVPKKIVYVGRITPIKNLETFIKAIQLLNGGNQNEYRGEIVGGPVTDADKKYEAMLKEKVRKEGLESSVFFHGPVSSDHLPQIYAKSFATVNLSPQGGMDKTVLESLACGRPVFASNAAFSDMFGEYKNLFMFSENDAYALRSKIQDFNNTPDKVDVVRKLSEKVRKEYGVSTLVQKVNSILLSKDS